MTPKHVPMRTCIECRQVRPKRELVRIVRTPEGNIQIDERGKLSGRGAYVCRTRLCWEQALDGNRLDHALKAKLSAEQRELLLDYGTQLPDSDRLEDA
jgi:predicted RNA-binding protein YlxR (DUF448 family)